MHADLVGDILEHQRAHRLGSELEERLLRAHDRAGDLEHGLGAGLEALDQPARFLQLALEVVRIVAARLRDQARIVLVDAQARLATRRERNLPATTDLARVRVRRDEFGCRGREPAAGLGRQRAHQRERGVEIAFLHVQALADARAVLARDGLQMVGDEHAREIEPGCPCVECFELHGEAFLERTTRDADRVELLHAPAHRGDFRRRHHVQRRKRLANAFVGLGQVAVVVDRLDDRGRDRMVARRHRREVELPQEVVAQVLGFGILRFEAILVERGPAVLAALELEVERLFVGVGCLDRFGLFERLGVAVAVLALGRFLAEVEQGIGFEREIELDLQLQPRKLQQPDRLLQLRRQGQRLAQTELESGFHARSVPSPVSAILAPKPRRGQALTKSALRAGNRDLPMHPPRGNRGVLGARRRGAKGRQDGRPKDAESEGELTRRRSSCTPFEPWCPRNASPLAYTPQPSALSPRVPPHILNSRPRYTSRTCSLARMSAGVPCASTAPSLMM